MRCIVCDGTTWKNVDEFRDSPKGMAMCASCGFVSYPGKIKSEEEMREFYRKQYRKPPVVNDLFTGERKVHYHEYHLRPLLEQWKQDGNTAPVIGEIGSAFGMFLRWMKEQVPGADLNGCELDLSRRRVAFHQYGLRLSEDFDFNKRYDLIASYHVLEHQRDADQLLRRYAEALKPSGVIYLGTPIWFREAANFGASGFDLSYYWAPDHINCWSEQHLERIIAKAGLCIVYKNDTVYGNTYILSKPNGEQRVADVSIAPMEEHLAKIKKIQACWKHIQLNETQEAIDAYPNCPTAWVHHYEHKRTKFHADQVAIKAFLEKAIANCPNTADVYTLAGDVMTRYERFDEGYAYFEQALARKPQNPSCLMAMANCLRQKALREKDPALRVDLFIRSRDLTSLIREISFEISQQATTWIFHDEAQIPMENENV